MIKEFYATEKILPDDYKVWINYIYIIDGRIMHSWLNGTVKDLKEGVANREVRSCDIVKRKLI